MLRWLFLLRWLAFRHDVDATFFEPWSPCHKNHAEGKRALVTGVSGMLGSHIAEALLQRGYEVYGVIRPRSNIRNIASFSRNITVLTAELTDSWRTLKLIRESAPDYIFHFAAQAFNSLSFDDPEYTLSTNMMSTLNILEAVRQSGRVDSVKILVAGSSTVYGSSTEQWDGPIPEEAPMQPVSPYGVSKAATELLTLQYTRTHKVHAIVARFFIHLAPRGVEALALHEFARQIALIERGLQEPVIQHGDISTSRDITDIVDSAPVVACLAEVAESGTVVNIGSNISYTMSGLLNRAIDMSHVPSIKLVTDPARLRAYDERVVMADISRIKSITGWQPRPNMDHLIALLLDYWRREISFRYPLQETSSVRNEL